MKDYYEIEYDDFAYTSHPSMESYGWATLYWNHHEFPNQWSGHHAPYEWSANSGYIQSYNKLLPASQASLGGYSAYDIISWHFGVEGLQEEQLFKMSPKELEELKKLKK